MTEADLADLGVFRIPVPVPFAAAGGPVNAYLVEEAGGGWLLWDAGLGSPEAEAALAEGFRRLGRRFDEVTRIVVSHGHVDHYGGARTVQERHGGALPAFAHPDDTPKIAEDGWRWRDRMPLYGAYLLKLGVPAEELAAIGQEGERGFRLARRLPEVRAVGEGEVLRTRHLELHVLHMPGHTPGLLCLHDERHRLFFSDDHLLEKISPNPLIELGPDGEEGWFRPLSAYLASLERTRALDLDLVLPGHATPFADHRAVIDRLVPFYGKRQERIRAVVAAGPRTGWEIARELFPKAPTAQTFLVISETMANLEVMEDRGELARTLVDGVYRFG